MAADCFIRSRPILRVDAAVAGGVPAVVEEEAAAERPLKAARLRIATRWVSSI